MAANLNLTDDEYKWTQDYITKNFKKYSGGRARDDALYTRKMPGTGVSAWKGEFDKAYAKALADAQKELVSTRQKKDYSNVGTKYGVPDAAKLLQRPFDPELVDPNSAMAGPADWQTSDLLGRYARGEQAMPKMAQGLLQRDTQATVDRLGQGVQGRGLNAWNQLASQGGVDQSTSARLQNRVGEDATLAQQGAYGQGLLGQGALNTNDAEIQQGLIQGLPQLDQQKNSYMQEQGKQANQFATGFDSSINQIKDAKKKLIGSELTQTNLLRDVR